MFEVLTLIQQTRELDDCGDPVVTEVSREVIGTQRSVTRSEFYEAHAVGLKPELVFVLSDYLDYEGEQWAEYDGQRYRVKRTYRKGQELELVLYQEVNPT